MSPTITLSSCGTSSRLVRAQDAADARDALIVARRLPDDVAVVERRHGAELENAEFALIESVAPLPEQDRPGRIEPDQKRDQREQRRGNQQQADRRAHIEDALDDNDP